MAHRTKIVATLGPATATPEALGALLDAGVNVLRLNFSHGDHATHAATIRRIRAIAAGRPHPVAILQDLQGPKIRTGTLQDGPVELVEGQSFTITAGDAPGNASGVATDYAPLALDVKAGDRILLSDGLIELRVEETDGKRVRTKVVHGGRLKERQGINLPGVDVSARGVTDKDFADLAFGIAQGVDYVAISFVRSPADVVTVKDEIARLGAQVPVIAKIEKPEAVESIEAIVEASDGIMVARGDLGVELSPERVPLLQKQIIRLANQAAKPVITATQMLESMIENPRPTRAEASDVANAILDGTDAVMLSGETAVGRHPIRAVQTLVRVAREVARDQRRGGIPRREIDRRRSSGAGSEAIGSALAALVHAVPDLAAVWIFTQSGRSARIASSHRPPVPIHTFSPNADTCQRMALLWGVEAIALPVAATDEELENLAIARARALGLVEPGATVALSGSHPFGRNAPTNFVKLLRIPDDA